jgi:uncharacterized protein (TIGR02569 family)
VLASFRASGRPVPLEGGESRSWRCGDVVFKPCDIPAEWAWLGEHLPTVRQEGFRLALPLQARDGRWVVDGWCAQPALSGAHPVEGRWEEVLAACERFHRAARHLPCPPFLDARTDPWAIGDRAAWGEADPPDYEPIRRLADARREVDLVSQYVHGDVTENVLFAEGQDPAIIDLASYWRPAGLASAVVVADAICWRRANSEQLLRAVAHVDEFPQLLVRALIARMTTTVVFATGALRLEGYRRAVDLALRLVQD